MMFDFHLFPNDIISSIGQFHNAELQFDAKCDCCGKNIKDGDKVIGKIITRKSYGEIGSSFSPTCLECAPDWMKHTADLSK